MTLRLYAIEPETPGWIIGHAGCPRGHTLTVKILRVGSPEELHEIVAAYRRGPCPVCEPDATLQLARPFYGPERQP